MRNNAHGTCVLRYELHPLNAIILVLFRDRVTIDGVWIGIRIY
jgi:hypothetical protein